MDNIPPNILQAQLHAQMKRQGMLHKAEPRSRVNEWAKFIVTGANSLFTLLGVTIIGGALYAIFADFGALDKNLFLGIGILFILFGVIIITVAYLGGQGVYYQRKESKFTMWKGSLILSIYQLFLVGTLTAELVWVGISLNAFVLLKNNAQTVVSIATGASTGAIPEVSSLEDKIAVKFNAFFFGASSICNNPAYQWFWNFVNKRCAQFDPNMAQLTCQRCGDYSVTACTADAKACYSPTSGYAATACPYAACRAGVLQFILVYLTPFVAFGLGVMLFQLVLIASNCALICYHRRDTDAEIKAKNGIFAAKTAGSALEPSFLIQENELHQDYARGPPSHGPPSFGPPSHGPPSHGPRSQGPPSHGPPNRITPSAPPMPGPSRGGPRGPPSHKR